MDKENNMSLRFILTAKEKQRSIALKLGISESYLSLILSGKRNPSIKVAKRISRLFHISLDTIFKER